MILNAPYFKRLELVPKRIGRNRCAARRLKFLEPLMPSLPGRRR